MIMIILLIIFLVIILFVLKKNSKNKSNIFSKLILAVIILGVLFIFITSGRFILPQLLQLLKIGIPILTKFIGL